MTFTNTTPITIPIGANASPYPSPITVAGATGTVVSVSVTLRGVRHTYAGDLDILLVGPQWQATMLMSDVGGPEPIADADLTFVETGGATLPDFAPIFSGTYEPTDYEPGDVLPSPAPDGSFGTDLTVFNGTDPSGVWQLFVYDDSPEQGSGAIAGGWVLNLQLASPPAIQLQPADQTVAPGETAVFHVSVAGTPPFGYQWLRNGQVVMPFDQGTDTLTITNAQAANAGTYAVRVTNSASPTGVVSSNAMLKVLGPLILVESPQSQLARPGQTVQFRVTAAGDPPVFYQWRLNGALLPAQTNSTLTISNVQADTGGRFDVIVLNNNEAIQTDPAVLRVTAATDPPPTDLFRDRPQLQSVEGVVQGDSSRATGEADEPIVPGGGKTVWFEWQAPISGIVTLTSQGSAFDTVLKVFTGTDLSKLTPLADDDDRGGFFTSRIQFNAQQGATYEIMLDGLGPGGGGGDFTVSWLLEHTKDQVPMILSNPAPQVVLPDSNAVFSVLTDSPSDTYQWFHNGAAIRGATGSVYVVSAQAEDVGLYHVRVGNAFGRFVESPPVGLELGFGDLTQPEYQKAQANGNRPTLGFAAIALGGVVWKQGEVPPPGPAIPCGQSWGPIAQGLHAEDDGIMLVHTTGSTVAARIAVYDGYHEFNETNLACGPVGNPSLVLFPAVQGSDYTVEAEPVLAGGDIVLTNMLGRAPDIPAAPDHCSVPPGASILLSMPATNWVPVPDCQWRHDGVDIADATNTALLLTNFSLVQTGAYSVVMSNFVRVTTNTVALLDLGDPLVLEPALSTNASTVDFVITASNATPFVLQTRTNLAPNSPWLPLTTNLESCQTFLFTNADILVEPSRFFRVVPWPPPGP